MVDDLTRARAETLAQIDALTREFDEVVAASKSSNADDEHDPEGATIAFERQQVAALLARARRRLADVDAALVRAAAGDYGTCADCGRPIAAERLEARPQARTCIECAGGPAPRR
ncbi:TraR/DksA family transcriptional regulator [Modestobacter lapidis]|nr:TraR/DksA family transcriptional regulator [Modestobacter lapidis]